MINATVKISGCKDCPFSRWSDHACGYGNNGTICNLSNQATPFNPDPAHHNNQDDYAHPSCPLKENDFTKNIYFNPS